MEMAGAEFMATQNRERGKWDMGKEDLKLESSHICDFSFT